MKPLGHILERSLEERVQPHAGLRHETDGVHHAVQLVALSDHLGDTVGKAVQVLLILHIELQQRRGLGQALSDALDETQPVESGEHQLCTLLLRDLRDVERDRRIGDDARHQDPLALK